MSFKQKAAHATGGWLQRMGQWLTEELGPQLSAKGYDLSEMGQGRAGEVNAKAMNDACQRKNSIATPSQTGLATENTEKPVPQSRL